MQRIQLGNRPQTLADRHRAMRSQIAATTSAAPDLQVAPVTAVIARETREERESRRYWEVVAEFKRFGRNEYHQSGTPWVGDAFGF